jgi:hypothetical protein
LQKNVIAADVAFDESAQVVLNSLPIGIHILPTIENAADVEKTNVYALAAPQQRPPPRNRD